MDHHLIVNRCDMIIECLTYPMCIICEPLERGKAAPEMHPMKTDQPFLRRAKENQEPERCKNFQAS